MMQEQPGDPSLAAPAPAETAAPVAVPETAVPTTAEGAAPATQATTPDNPNGYPQGIPAGTPDTQFGVDVPAGQNLEGIPAAQVQQQELMQHMNSLQQLGVTEGVPTVAMMTKMVDQGVVKDKDQLNALSKVPTEQWPQTPEFQQLLETTEKQVVEGMVKNGPEQVQQDVEQLKEMVGQDTVEQAQDKFVKDAVARGENEEEAKSRVNALLGAFFAMAGEFVTEGVENSSMERLIDAFFDKAMDAYNRYRGGSMGAAGETEKSQTIVASEFRDKLKDPQKFGESLKKAYDHAPNHFGLSELSREQLDKLAAGDPQVITQVLVAVGQSIHTQGDFPQREEAWKEFSFFMGQEFKQHAVLAEDVKTWLYDVQTKNGAPVMDIVPKPEVAANASTTPQTTTSQAQAA